LNRLAKQSLYAILLGHHHRAKALTNIGLANYLKTHFHLDKKKLAGGCLCVKQALGLSSGVQTTQHGELRSAMLAAAAPAWPLPRVQAAPSRLNSVRAQTTLLLVQ
jgi:hypothetical protein